MRKNIAMFLLLLFGGALFLLIFQNMESVFIKFLTYETTVSLSIVILVSAIVGAFIFRLIWRILKWGLKKSETHVPTVKEESDK